MDDTAFWKLIDASRRGHSDDADGLADALVERLGKLPVEALFDFQAHVERRIAQAYRADLWGAAHLIHGGCSDDGFDYFLGWLVSRGQKVFDAALANPDSLASAARGDECELEALWYAASHAYDAKTGKSDFYERAKGMPRSLEGDLGAWSDDDGEVDEAKAKRLYPRLWKKFCEG